MSENDFSMRPAPTAGVRQEATRYKQTFTLAICIIAGALTLWLYFLLSQLGERPATNSAPRPVSGKLIELLPMLKSGLAVKNFRQHLLFFFSLIALQFFLLGVVIWLLLRLHVAEFATDHRFLLTIFIFAVLFRLALLPQTPWLSDDLYRYLWDGRVLANGLNPFRYPPNATELAHLRDVEIFPLINHKEVVTVYPPVLQAIFYLAHQFGGGIIALKGILIFLDVLIVALLFWVLPKFGSPSWWAIFYAWHPLAVVEIAGSGHIDGAGALFMLAAIVLLALRQKKVAAMFCFALAFLVKFLSMLLLPFLLLQKKAQKARLDSRALVLLVFFIAIVFFSYLPFADAGQNLVSGLTVYAAKWRFNDSIFALFYEPIHALLPNTLVTKLMIPPQWDITAEVLLTRRVDLALLSTKALMVFFFLSFLLVQWRKYSKEKSAKESFPSFRPLLAWPLLTLNVLGMFLLLSPTVQPWYLLWILPFLCIIRQPGWMAWSATIFLAYWILDGYARTGTWQESNWVKCLEYGLAAIIAAATRLGNNEKRFKFTNKIHLR